MPLGEEEPWDDEVVFPPEFSIAPPESANVSVKSNGPGPSSTAPGQSTEPQPTTDEGDRSDSGEPAPIPEFNPKVRQPFEGLLYLGKLTKTFTWVGHTFVIRTLTTDEVLEVGLLHREYAGTISDAKAYQAALVAACVVSLDGKPLVIPITDEPTDTPLRNRFEYVRRHWFPPVLDVIYEEYLKLEAVVNEVINTMGKASGWTESTPTWKSISV